MMDAYGSVREFERYIAEYTGAPHVVTVDSCSNALVLCCNYPPLRVRVLPEVEIPSITYPSVASAIVHAGGRIKFCKEMCWQEKGWYELNPTGIIDSAKYLSRNMFMEIKNESKQAYVYICLSFHAKKSVPIGRGGAILTNDKESVEWFRAARFDGRHEKPLQDDTLVMPGWNCYMTPEQASRGLVLMQWLSDFNLLEPDPYTDLSQYKFFTGANR
jgi:dTDP-4-amino-4,6-dideoxygalactose transaminase